DQLLGQVAVGVERQQDVELLQLFAPGGPADQKQDNEGEGGQSVCRVHRASSSQDAVGQDDSIPTAGAGQVREDCGWRIDLSIRNPQSAIRNLYTLHQAVPSDPTLRGGRRCPSLSSSPPCLALTIPKSGTASRSGRSRNSCLPMVPEDRRTPPRPSSCSTR